jgi:AmmeMemoRadiSam system protein A
MDTDSMLSKSEKQFLLEIARASVGAAVRLETAPKRGDCPPVILRPSGAFVTLHEKGELRGCIGYIEAIKPMIDTVREVAAKAATSDPRFAPVTPEELPILEIEISVISPMKRIQNIDEIEVGKHGLLLERGMYRGLLLPQVATEYGWDRETFLNQTARKAGLEPTAWKKPGTTIYTFTAEIFGERSMDSQHS